MRPTITRLSSPQLRIDPFGMAVLHRQRLTRFDKRANVLLVLTLTYTLRITISMWKIVGGVVRYRDFVVKIKKKANFFPGVFVGDSRKFVHAKISRYTVIEICNGTMFDFY